MKQNIKTLLCMISIISLCNTNNLFSDDPNAVAAKKAYIRKLRDIELPRTDFYMILDLFLKFTPEHQYAIVAYRQALRDAPNHDTLADLVMPACPACITPGIDMSQYFVQDLTTVAINMLNIAANTQIPIQ